jgi:hypothetical protein
VYPTVEDVEHFVFDALEKNLPCLVDRQHRDALKFFFLSCLESFEFGFPVLEFFLVALESFFASINLFSSLVELFFLLFDAALYAFYFAPSIGNLAIHLIADADCLIARLQRHFTPLRFRFLVDLPGAPHVVTRSEPGLMQLFDALHFPLTTTKSPEFGELPITRIGIGISTTRPSDALVIESAELTGMDAFEEVVRVDEITQLADPLRERLLEIARQQAPELVSR